MPRAILLVIHKIQVILFIFHFFLNFEYTIKHKKKIIFICRGVFGKWHSDRMFVFLGMISHACL